MISKWCQLRSAISQSKNSLLNASFTLKWCILFTKSIGFSDEYFYGNSKENRFQPMVYLI